MSLDLSTLPAFTSRQNVGEYSIVSFNISNSYEMPVELLTSHILQFENVLTFSSKLIQREKSITDEFTRESMFAEYLKGVKESHIQEITLAEKKSLSEILPLVESIKDIERSKTDTINSLRQDYEQQIKALQKTNKMLETDSAILRSELELSQQKETKVLQRRIIDLESDLQRASRGESIIRDQCKSESDRLIKALDDKNKEILSIKEESLEQSRQKVLEREQKVSERESELQNKTKRQSSSVLLGHDGEHLFAKLAKDKMNWTLTKAPTHSCDYSTVILDTPALFEIKNWSKPIPEKEVTKFIADMKMHPEALVGVFVSLNTGITGRRSDSPIAIDWIHGSQCIIYIQSCAELDIDHILSLIQELVRVSGMIRRVILSQEESQEPNFQQRIEDTKVYLERAISNITKVITKITVDKKNVIALVESASKEHIHQLKLIITEITNVSHTLLGITNDHTSEDTLESEPAPTIKKTSKKKASAHL